MSGRARLALCAAAATLMAACALLPLVDPATWILQAAFLLAVQTGVGALTRRVPLARPLTVAVQALVTLMLLTLVFARQQAIAGIVPGPEAFHRLGMLLQAGTDDVGRFAIPAPLSEGIRLMMVGGVLVIGLAVDALAVTFRSAAPAGLPLLALYSVAAGLSGGGAAWLWFLLAAAGYLMLLLAEGRDRLSQWGRVFGGAARTAGPESSTGALAPVRTGRRIGAVALGIALVVPLGLPALDGGLLDGAGRGVGSGTGGGGTISAVNPLVSLRDSLNVNEDRQVMSYRTNTDDTQDLYLRIVSLDDFDGTAWKPAQRHIIDVPDTFPTPTGLGGDVRRTEIRTRIAAADWYAQDWLPMPYPANKVNIKGNWRYEPVGRTLVGDHGQNTRGAQYEVTSLIVQPTAEQLANAPEPSDDMKRDYTNVPSSLPPVVGRTARQVTEGAQNHYEQAVKLQDYFAVTGGFTYDTQVQAGSGSAAIAKFLKDKEGFCVHFSFAMAAMARTLGIPARVAVGFTPGSPQGDGSMSVGLRDAHAWPELYFEGIGWTRFEPTPNRGSVPSYTQPDSSGSDLPDVPKPSTSASTAPSAAPSASESCSAEQKKLEACSGVLPQNKAGSGDDGPPWYKILWWTLAGAAVLALPLVPMLWRLRSRSLRLASSQHAPAAERLSRTGRTARGAAEGFTDGIEVTAPAGEDTSRRASEVAATHTLAVWRELTDTAWDYGIVPDDALTPRKAAARIVRIGQLEPGPAESVHRVAGAVERVLYAPQPRPEAGLADDVRRLRMALRSSSSRTTRLRALVAPRSAIRVVWDLSERWTAVKARWAARTASLLRRPSSPGEQNG
ncbi:transglutaminase TgpA family protein [Streptomyces sp. SAS_270]|uniref:transglutaminase TgpA family protein n=1 Tax=Streptomyces sp. SAS_270 TaxID=3412748 RepID=UPI00403CB6BD